MSSLIQSAAADVAAPSPAAAADAGRVAEIGYTAVIDRFTPRLSFADIAANVGRSVGNGGGAPAEFPEFAAIGSPVWQLGAVTVFEDRHTHGPLDQPGPIAVAITAQASETRAAVATTVVLHEPSESLRRDAQVVADALQAALAELRDGVAAKAVAATYRAVIVAGSLGADVPATLGVPVVVGATASLRVDAAPEAVLRTGDVLALLALARTEDGVIAFGTSVRITDDGAARLDGIPLRLIELR